MIQNLLMNKSYVTTMIPSLNKNNPFQTKMIQTMMMTCVEYKDHFGFSATCIIIIMYEVYAINFFFVFFFLNFFFSHLCVVN
jgi:hypothetical protein